MKLLFDQNISFLIIKRLRGKFPEIANVKSFKLENTPDSKIWDFAKINSYFIVTYDNDFYDFSLVKGFPPKIILIKSGNLKLDSLVELLLENFDDIQEFSEKKEFGCLLLTKYND